MSRRFGRNQKRKMREQVATMAASRDYWLAEEQLRRKELKTLRDRSANDREALDHLKHALPRYCALLPPEELQLQELRQEFDWLRLPGQEPRVWRDGPGVNELVYAAEQVMEIPVIKARLIQDPQDMGVNVLVRHGSSGRWGYATNARSIQIMGRAKASRYIAETLARTIAADLQGIAR